LKSNTNGKEAAEKIGELKQEFEKICEDGSEVNQLLAAIRAFRDGLQLPKGHSTYQHIDKLSSFQAINSSSSTMYEKTMMEMLYIVHNRLFSEQMSGRENAECSNEQLAVVASI
jgi:hypothetical protein